MVIHGRIRTCYLCFTYTPVFTISLVPLGERERTNEVQAVEVSFLYPSQSA